MSFVSIVKCDNYEIDKVKASIKKSIDYLGGMSFFIKPGDKVLLKVNLLMKRKPDKATTTHPTLAQALAELVTEAGGFPIIGDSPGGYHFYNKKTLESVYESCGMKEAAGKSNAELNYNTEVIDVSYPEGKIMKSIKTIKPVLEVDKIINIPKIKTHMMTVYSGAVKNLFGIIPGSFKAEYHLRFEDTNDFADLLIDICEFAKPILTVMDAVIGMEGYGPTNGSPKKVGLIIAGSNPYELDVIAAKIIGLEPKVIPTVKKSMERGLCSGNLQDINVLGEQIESVYISDFKIPTRKLSFNFYNLLLPKFISKRLNRFMKAKPCFNHKACKGCGVCAKSCPPKAIVMKDGKPIVDLDKCIRCFCCHELCDYDAVDIKRPWIIRVILR
jgi:uncharacterized protein (DUF362 family)/Pyruvate/2-oxoacid:ferredoxin oxidoreductase delta subunit